MLNRVLFLCLFFAAVKCFAQDTTVAGIVFDKDNKYRVASVNIHDLTTHTSAFNSLKGEFKITAKAGDKLVFYKPDYHPDTLILKDDKPLMVYMSRLAIQLKEVTVHDTAPNPENRLAATKQEYSKAYGSLAYSDFLSASPGGAGLSIDAIYNALSREGRNAARLREIIENDYEQNVIDYRFNRNFVGSITGLKDERLTSFMMRYRPGYYTSKTASDYEFISMIKANLRRFLRTPLRRTYSLPPLQESR